MDWSNLSKKYRDYLIEQRRYFHKYPELSGKEFNTSKHIKEELDKYNIEYVSCGLKTGVLATIRGEGEGNSKSILLRADMDALNIQEETSLEFISENNNVMHACGHDCHMAMLLTACRICNDHKKEFSGTIKFAFQPAEEIGQGAVSMLDEGALKNVDGAFAIHVWSTIPSGKIICNNNAQLASTDIIKIYVQGKGGHASSPHECVDAVVLCTNIVNTLQLFASRYVSPLEPTVLTIGIINVGTRWNIIADKGYIEGTLRCLSMDLWREAPAKIEALVKKTAQALGGDALVEFERLSLPVVNDSEFSELVNCCARDIMGENAVLAGKPYMASEDFAFFLENTKGAMALLGVGNEELGASYPQHSCHYIVDEGALFNGALLYSKVAFEFLAGK